MAKTIAEIIADRLAEKAAKQEAAGGLSWNAEQQAAISLSKTVPAKSFCLTGPAGSGKSTVTAEILKPLLRAAPLTSGGKYLRVGSPGVAIVAFTRRAANNIRKMVVPELKGNVMTIHKLLEFTVVYEEVITEDGKLAKKRTFQPKRTALNPLPSSLRIVVIDESSTVTEELYAQLRSALHPNTTIIFIGDINQLPPVGGDSIFGYKLNELPTVELRQVYRQALESAPLALAHRILSGKPISTPELKNDWATRPGLRFHLFPPGCEENTALRAAVGVLKKQFQAGTYDPVEDIVLCPFNVRFGTDELNAWILDFAYPERRVYEIVAGYETKYLAVGDYVLFNKDEFIISEIKKNAAYTGRQPAQVPVDRWGRAASNSTEEEGIDAISAMLAPQEEGTALDYEFDLEALATSGEERVNQASHILYLKSLEFPDDPPLHVSTAGDMNAITFAHAITVHKSQGSGWRKVFLMIHKSHAQMLSRELLYTAVTRTKEHLEIFCENDTFYKGVQNARIPGTTAQEKAEFFRKRRSEKAVAKALEADFSEEEAT